MNILRPLSPHLHRLRQFLYPFLIIITIVGFFYYLCLGLDSIDVFQTYFWKTGFSLGGRALYGFLIKMGCSGGLVLALGFAVKALLATEAAPYPANMVLPQGGDGASSSESSFPSSSGSTSTSLIGHASDESKSENNSLNSPRAPSTSSSTPEADQSGFLSFGEKTSFWKPKVLRGVQDLLE